MPCQAWTIRKEDVIRACIDIGSGRMKISAQLVTAGNVPGNFEIVTINIFGTARSYIDLRLIYDGSEIVLGSENVTSWIEKHPTQADRVLEQFKLALCPKYKDSTTVRRVYHAIEVPHDDLPEIQELYTDLLRFCEHNIRHHMRRMSNVEVSIKNDPDLDDHWRDIPIELHLTVPVMWGDVARGIMRNAAKNAGFVNTALRSEPLCVARCYINEGWRSGSARDGDIYTFMDYGRGTVLGYRRYLVVYQLFLRLDRKMMGDLVGCQFVNDLAWESIRRSYGTRIEDLGISEAAAHQQFTSQFEVLKTLFPNCAVGYHIKLRGSFENQQNGKMPAVVIELFEEQMEAWFRMGVSKATEVLARHLARFENLRPKAVLLSGGGATNDFTRKILSKEIEALGLEFARYTRHHENAVSIGGLEDDLENAPDAYPSQIEFYVGRGEFRKARRQCKRKRKTAGTHDVDEDTHGADWTQSKMSDRSDLWDPEMIRLPDRLIPILSINPEKDPISRVIPMLYEIAAKEGKSARFTTTIFSSSRTDLARKPHVYANGKEQPGLTAWPLSYADPPDLEAFGFRAKRALDGVRYYKVDGSIQMVKHEKASKSRSSSFIRTRLLHL